jgi:Smg protein
MDLTQPAVPPAEPSAGGTQRELVIERLMALDGDEIDLEKLKWVVLMVLFSQPGQETAFSRMEDLVFEEHSGAVH